MLTSYNIVVHNYQANRKIHQLIANIQKKCIAFVVSFLFIYFCFVYEQICMYTYIYFYKCMCKIFFICYFFIIVQVFYMDDVGCSSFFIRIFIAMHLPICASFILQLFKYEQIHTYRHTYMHVRT